MSALSDFLPQVGTDLQATAGLQRSENLQQEFHDTTGEENTDAAKGSFYSGGRINRQDWIKQQATNKSSDIGSNLQQQLNQLAINRILAATGVSSIQ
ncbi:MAG TPA: hypothetical protein VN903_37185 [Polyangia bacterium]|nr:hypothetical protein [Polyangia bacterium]